MKVKPLDILEKYKLKNKAWENYHNKYDKGPTNYKKLYKCFAEVLSEKWGEKRDQIQKLQEKNCIKLNQINTNGYQYTNCEFWFNKIDNEFCKECDYYNKKIRSLEISRDELKRASNYYEKNARYINFKD